MNPPPNREVVIFNAALELPASQRGAYLLEACADDPALRVRIEDLLRVHEQAGAFMETPAPEARESPGEAAAPGATIGFAVAPSEKPGDRIGRYKLLQQIGEGGCGVVYMAEQEEPVRRRVALKVIKLGMDTRQVIARFEAERQALALMDHPNIARVFDAGATETGRPYFVMELIKGIPITRYCDENNLSTATRLGLFIQVCQAIQHAHQKGIIHRDIKPSNVLVADHDGVPVPKIIDFGIAKATSDQRLTDKTVFTAFEQFMGTAAYMSPEQARLSGLDIDTRSDIYSLGVLLYELLTGKTPFEAKRLLEAGLDEIRQIIREEEPPRPSTKLQTMGLAEQTTIAIHRQSNPPKLVHMIRGDLDWIVMKALEKDRVRRYETANGLARDVERHLKNEPVTAAAPRGLYRLRKAALRHKLGLCVMAVIGLVLVAGIAGSTSEMVRANRYAARATQVAETLAANLYAADIFLAQSAMRAGDYGLAQRSLMAHVPVQGGRDLRGFEWRYLRRLCQGDKLVAWKAHEDAIRTVAVSPDGNLLASTSSDQEGKLWDARTHRLLLRFEDADCAAFSPDSRLLLAAGWSGNVQVWNVSQKRRVNSFSTGAKPWEAPRAQLAVSPTEPIVAVCTDGNFFGGRGSVYLYNYETSTQISCLTNCGDRMAFSSDGKLLVVGSAGGEVTVGEVTVWNMATGKAISKMRGFRGVASLAVSPQGGLLASTEFWSGDIRLWDIASGKELAPLRGHPVMAWQVIFSPDGRMLVSGSSDQKINLWDVASHRLLSSMIGHQSEVWSLAFSPDGKQLFSGSADETIAIWPTNSNHRDYSIPVTGTHESPPLFSPDGLLVAVGAGPGESPIQVNLWELESPDPKAILPNEKAALWFSPDAKVLVTLSTDSEFHFWDLQTQIIRRRVTLSDNASARNRTVASKDGHLAAGLVFDSSRTGWVPRLYDMNSGLCQGELRGSIRSVLSLEFSPDCKFLATAGEGMLELWDVHSCKLLRTMHASKSSGTQLTFSPRDDILATCNVDHLVKLWSVPDLRALGTLNGHREGVNWVAFSPDGQTLASACEDGWVKLWHIATRRELASFKQVSYARFTGFSPDGKTLAVAPGWGRMCFLRTPSLAELDAASLTLP